MLQIAAKVLYGVATCYKTVISSSKSVKWCFESVTKMLHIECCYKVLRNYPIVLNCVTNCYKVLQIASHGAGL